MRNSKKPEIVAICEALKAKFGDSIRLNENWDSDSDAIGISHPSEPDKLAYICVYPKGYFVSLEEPAEAGSVAPYRSMGEFNGLTTDEVVAVIGRHLGVSPMNQKPREGP